MGSALAAEPEKPAPAKPAAPAFNPDPKLDAKVNGGILPAKYHGLPLVWIPKLDAPKKLSGDLKDEVWKKAATVELGEVIGGGKLKLKTEALLFCTADALYIGYRCEEPKLDALKLNEGEIWSRDEVEIFFEPAKDTIKKCYHQIIIDAGNDTWKGRTHIYPNYKYQQLHDDWEPNFESATGKGEKAWTLEAKVPFEQMKLSDEAKAKKTLWRLNLNRVRPAKEDGEDLNYSWSPLGAKYFHTAGKFGYALPESFATPELVEEVKKSAAQGGAPAREAEPALVYEVRKRIGELEAELFSERDTAAERLRKLAQQDAVAAQCVYSELLDSTLRARDSQAAGAAKALLGEVKASADEKKEDDPPPDNMRAMMGQLDQ
ncbi:MAG: carbohydrate-binding family 9-like protein [Planctomycetes bacterium]|nr:carbohydrate-binding family 9-like protein [Planctomycetota bacterium]